jgi:DNA repair protein SbcC/Rad50
MKINLKNFRCYRDFSVELPDTGLVLLSGDSGSGKSTLLKGILYGLYGGQVIKKPYTFGSTTCSVTIDIKGMKINRSKPHRVTVDNMEDEIAQKYIDEKIGLNFEEFILSSYVPQKNNTSILSLTGLEQIAMLKRLAFEGNKNEIYEKKIKEMLSQSSDNLVKKQSEQSFCKGEIDRINNNLNPIDFPLNPDGNETEEETIHNYKLRLRSFNERIENLLTTKNEYITNIQSFDKLQKDLVDIEQSISNTNISINNLSTKEKELLLLLQMLPIDLERLITNTKLNIKYIKLNDDLNILKQQYEDIRKAELNQRDKTLKDLKGSLWLQQSKDECNNSLNMLKKELDDWQKYVKNMNDFKVLLKKLNINEDTTIEKCKIYFKEVIEKISRDKESLYKLKQEYIMLEQKLKLEKEIVHCPECNKPLKWKKNTLISVDDYEPVEHLNYEEKIKQLDKDILIKTNEKKKYEDSNNVLNKIVIPKLTHELSYYESIQEKLTQVEDYYSENISIENEIKKLEKPIEKSPALIQLQERINSVNKQINCIDTDTIDLDANEENLNTLLIKYETQNSNYKQYSKNLKEIQGELTEFNNKLKDFRKKMTLIKDKLENINIDNLKKKLIVIEKDILKTKKKQTEDEDLSEKVELYLKYKSDKVELDRWESKYSVTCEELKIAENVHTANLTIKEKYHQAEVLALQSTIFTINEHTRYFLDTFFPDNQLIAELVPINSGKKMTTLKINTSLKYKGNEYDSISQLSGGEFDRCTLASVCGINSMLNSPILILDESLSSLDSDTNTELLRFLKELAEDKLILVCSHEAVTGIFDEIIHI